MTLIAQKAAEGGFTMDWKDADKNGDNFVNREEFIPLYFYVT